MNTQTTLPISEARRRIFEIAEEVQKPNKYYTLTEKGRPKVVIMSAEDFESWQETLEVYKDFPDLDKDIKEARRDYKKGNYITLDYLLAKESLKSNTKIISKKITPKEYGVSDCYTQKNSKRSR